MFNLESVKIRVFDFGLWILEFGFGNSDFGTSTPPGIEFQNLFHACLPVQSGRQRRHDAMDFVYEWQLIRGPAFMDMKLGFWFRLPVLTTVRQGFQNLDFGTTTPPGVKFRNVDIISSRKGAKTRLHCVSVGRRNDILILNVNTIQDWYVLWTLDFWLYTLYIVLCTLDFRL